MYHENHEYKTGNDKLENIMNTDIILVKEFRLTVRNSGKGYVYDFTRWFK